MSDEHETSKLQESAREEATMGRDECDPPMITCFFSDFMEECSLNDSVRL